MSIKAILARVKDELDSYQVFVRLTERDNGILITATSEVDRLLAAKAVRRTGLTVAGFEMKEAA